MTTQPQVLSVRRPGGAVELDLRIPTALSYFPAHFPRFAMLPGVVQVDWAAAFAREHLEVRGGFRRLAGLKFQHPILPGAEVTLHLSCADTGEISFDYRSGDRSCSGGRIMFGAADD